MLISVHQFNPLKKYFVIGLLFVASLNVFAAKKVLFRDAILFKVDNQIFTLKETISLIEDLRKYNCMLDGSLMLRQLNIKQSEYSKFSSKFNKVLKTDKKINISKHKKILRKIVDLLKVKSFIKTQNIKVPREIYGQMIKAGQVNKCIGKTFELSDTYKSLMKLELYFKSRFYGQTYLVSKADLEKDYGKEFVSEKAKKQYIFKLKRSRAIKTFVKSLENQITHEENW